MVTLKITISYIHTNNNKRCRRKLLEAEDMFIVLMVVSQVYIIFRLVGYAH